MPKEFSRTERIASQIQIELARIIHAEVLDPRVRIVTITEVQVSPDLENAKIYVTTRADKDIKEMLLALKSVTPFLRRQLAKALQLRKTPQLRFYDDEALRVGQKISELLKDIEE